MGVYFIINEIIYELIIQSRVRNKSRARLFIPARELCSNTKDDCHAKLSYRDFYIEIFI